MPGGMCPMIHTFSPALAAASSSFESLSIEGAHQGGRPIFIHLHGWEVLPFLTIQRQRCIKFRVLSAQDFYTPLALNCQKGQHLPALEVYKNRFGRGVCETESKNGRSKPTPLFLGVICAQRGIETMVSDHGLGRGPDHGWAKLKHCKRQHCELRFCQIFLPEDCHKTSAQS